MIYRSVQIQEVVLNPKISRWNLVIVIDKDVIVAPTMSENQAKRMLQDFAMHGFQIVESVRYAA